MSADAPSWISGDLSGQQRDDLSTNPDDYGMYGKCINEAVQLAGAPSTTEACMFQAKSFRYSVISGILYVRMGDDQKLYPINNVGFTSNTHVTPSPNTDDFVFGPVVVKDLPSKIIFNSQNAGSYDPDENFSYALSLDEQNNDYTISSRSVSRNGEWEVINVQNIGFVRIHLTDLSVTRFTSYQNLNKFSAVSDDGRFVAVNSYNGSQPMIYDLENCGQSAAKLQSSWSGVAVSNPCASRDLSAVINDVFSSSGFNASAKPEFSDDSWQLTTFVVPSGGVGKGVTLNAADYTPPQADLDSDDDGLSDYVESRSYPNRQAVFCGTSCAYPDPSTKDLYVENDWINKSFVDYKPSSSQIDDIVDTFDNQNIRMHFDTGQYGGGRQILLNDSLIFAPTDDVLDFYDLKNGTSAIAAEFNPIRKNIWHYMITSSNFMKTESEEGGTGASYPGDDDSIISIEEAEALNPLDMDTAVVGTILHELGHNLCLSKEASVYYPIQSAECVYDQIDKPLDQNPSTDYESVMNYRFQLSKKDYSHGVNGATIDHNDWQAIALGLGDFPHSVFEWDDTQNQQQLRGHKSSNQLSRQNMIDSIQ